MSIGLYSYLNFIKNNAKIKSIDKRKKFNALFIVFIIKKYPTFYNALYNYQIYNNLSDKDCKNITVLNFDKEFKYQHNYLLLIYNDIAPFSNYYLNKIENLTILVINNKNIDNSGIKNLVNLVKLYCNNCIKLTNYAIQNLTELRVLSIKYNNNITDIGFKNLKLLQDLTISHSKKITGEFYKYTSKLKLLICEDTNIQNKFLNKMTTLNTLSIYKCVNITNKGIKTLINLTGLKCNGPRVTDIGLYNLTKIRTLDITNCNKITNILRFIELTEFIYNNRTYEYDSEKKEFILTHMPKF